MLEPLLGSKNRERVLVFLAVNGEGYARQISRFFHTGLAPIQNQLDRLEAGGVLYSRKAGRTKIFELDPRYPFLKELSALLKKSLSFYSDSERERLEMVRRRPRRKGKPE